MPIKKTKIIFTSLLISAFCTLQAQNTNPTPTLSTPNLNLKQALEYAIENHPNLKILHLQEKIGDIQVEINKINRMPNLYFSLTDELSLGRSLDFASYQFVDAKINYLNSSLNGDIILYEGGKKNKQIQMSQKTADINKSNTLKSILDIKTELIPIFLQAYYYQEEIKAQKDILKEIEQYHEKQKELWRFQLKPFTDTLISYSRLLDQQNKLNSSLNNKQLSLQDLAFYIQKQISDHLQLLVIEQPSTSLSLTDSLHEFQEDLINKNPEIIIQNKNIDLLKQKITLTKTAYYPKISLYGNIVTFYSSAQQGSLMTFNNQIENNFRQGIGVALQMPISTFYQTPKELKKINAELDKQIAEKEQTKLKINFQIQKNIIKFQQAKKEYENYDAIEKATAKTYYAIDEKVKKGLSNWFEWFQILNDWQNKKITLLRLKITYIQELEKLMLIQNLL